MKRKNILIFSFLLCLHTFVNCQSIVTSRHNLSVSGIGKVKATSETELCLFCHTPHNSSPSAPLWNRFEKGTTYTLYSSSTLQALPGQPDGSSMLCLSCHDGTVALGSVISREKPIDISTGIFMPMGKTNLGTNLSNDHPISFLYNSTLASTDGQLKEPTLITPPVLLKNSKVQCTSCHDPHKNIYSDFLVATSENSNLCNSCHDRTYWTASSHSTSTNTWNGSGLDPWPNTPANYTTVAQNACESCHNNHNAGSNVMLLKYQAEESNCLDCHSGNVSKINIGSQFNKAYKHDMTKYTNIHVANEPAEVANMHVECVDCHNPHASKNQIASAPYVNGFLTGVLGVNQSGVAVNPAKNSYEVCYRCHSGNTGSPSSATHRVIPQNNVRLEFAPGNPSYHSVASIGVNNDVPSLISPWTTSSRMYCTDCHSSDGAGSPAGPHGSIYPHILKFQYITTDNVTETPSAYALCYSCHSRASIRGNVSFKKHSIHLDNRTSCNTCHDSHGISSTQGNSFNNSNLINFSTTYVSPSSSGILRFEDKGNQTGSCYLTCHGKDHNPLSY